MKSRLSPVTRAIADHPWSSLQDALLLSGGMLVAVILALEYDLIRFGDRLTSEERRVTLGEMIFLTALLAAGIVAFIMRRLYESRIETIEETRRELEMRKLKDQTLRDPLTGVLNRRGILETLSSVINSQDARRHAFFLLDVDGFKRINDLHGHAVGDSALKTVVERLKAAARPADVLARLDGGDEFALLAWDVDREEAQAIGQRLIAALDKEVFAEGFAHKVSACAGAVLMPEQGMTGGEILSKADLAMYRAKEPDQPALVFYEAMDAPPQT